MFEFHAAAEPVVVQKVFDVNGDGFDVDRGDVVHCEQRVGAAAGSLHHLLHLAQWALALCRQFQAIEQVFYTLILTKRQVEGGMLVNISKT